MKYKIVGLTLNRRHRHTHTCARVCNLKQNGLIDMKLLKRMNENKTNLIMPTNRLQCMRICIKDADGYFDFMHIILLRFISSSLCTNYIHICMLVVSIYSHNRNVFELKSENKSMHAFNSSYTY